MPSVTITASWGSDSSCVSTPLSVKLYRRMYVRVDNKQKLCSIIVYKTIQRMFVLIDDKQTLCPTKRKGPLFRFGSARREVHGLVFVWAVGFLST